ADRDRGQRVLARRRDRAAVRRRAHSRNVGRGAWSGGHVSRARRWRGDGARRANAGARCPPRHDPLPIGERGAPPRDARRAGSHPAGAARPLTTRSRSGAPTAGSDGSHPGRGDAITAPRRVTVQRRVGLGLGDAPRVAARLAFSAARSAFCAASFAFSAASRAVVAFAGGAWSARSGLGVAAPVGSDVTNGRALANAEVDRADALALGWLDWPALARAVGSVRATLAVGG